MAYPSNRGFNEYRVGAFSTSVGTTPLACYAAAPCRGEITKVGVIISGTLSVDSSVAVAINGVAIGGSPFVITASGSVAGSVFSMVPSNPNNVNEDDAISFTPSGGTGASITGSFYAICSKTAV